VTLQNILILIVGVFSIKVLAVDAETFTYFPSKGKQAKEIKIIKHEGFRISQTCVKALSVKCDAWSALQNKRGFERKDIGTIGNPAASYCASYKAKNIIFINSKKQEFDYCYFSDNSVVDAWDLYNKHHK
jgi:hypothetical protein